MPPAPRHNRRTRAHRLIAPVTIPPTSPASPAGLARVHASAYHHSCPANHPPRSTTTLSACSPAFKTSPLKSLCSAPAITSRQRLASGSQKMIPTERKSRNTVSGSALSNSSPSRQPAPPLLASPSNHRQPTRKDHRPACYVVSPPASRRPRRPASKPAPVPTARTQPRQSVIRASLRAFRTPIISQIASIATCKPACRAGISFAVD